MSRILVVGSVHNPDIAAPEELFWLLRQLQPAVLFLEHPADEIERLHDQSCQTLECLAVRGYLRIHQATLAPVDVSRSTYELPESSMKAAFGEMFEAAEEASETYRLVSEAHAHATATAGFAYLNSPSGWDLEVRLARELARAIDSVGLPRISEHFALWSRFHDRREHAMLAGIQQFCRHHTFHKAVLLVGSAHRQPMRAKLEQNDYREVAALRWEFAWDLKDSDVNSGAPS